MNEKTWKSKDGCIGYHTIYTKNKKDYEWMKSWLRWRKYEISDGTRKNQYGDSLKDRNAVAVKCTTRQWHEIQRELGMNITLGGSLWYRF